MSATTTPVLTITHDELATLLGGLKGATILSLSWSGSDPARYKRDHGRITKLTRFSGMVNARYDKKKAKKLGISLEEVAISTVAWRERIGKTPILRHKTNGTRYVEFYPQSGGSQFTLDGSPCQKKEVADMLRPPSGGKNTVAYVTPKLENITAAVVGGQKYRVVSAS